MAPFSYISGVNDMPLSLDTSSLLFVCEALAWTRVSSSLALCRLRTSTQGPESKELRGASPEKVSWKDLSLNDRVVDLPVCRTANM